MIGSDHSRPIKFCSSHHFRSCPALWLTLSVLTWPFVFRWQFNTTSRGGSKIVGVQSHFVFVFPNNAAARMAHKNFKRVIHVSVNPVKMFLGNLTQYQLLEGTVFSQLVASLMTGLLIASILFNFTFSNIPTLLSGSVKFIWRKYDFHRYYHKLLIVFWTLQYLFIALPFGLFTLLTLSFLTTIHLCRL